MSRLEELAARIAAFGRPAIGLSHATTQWDEDHPAELEEYRRAMEEREAILSEMDRQAQLGAQQRRCEEAFDSCGAPLAERAAARNPSETLALSGTRDWQAQRERPVLVLTGGVGTGKTVAALWALLATSRSGQKIGYARALELSRCGLYGKGAERMEKMRRVGGLVLDELGGEPMGEIWLANFGELIDVRYGGPCRTIITSNLAWPALRERYGERVASRLHQKAIVLGTGTGDLRRLPP